MKHKKRIACAILHFLKMQAALQLALGRGQRFFKKIAVFPNAESSEILKFEPRFSFLEKALVFKAEQREKSILVTEAG